MKICYIIHNLQVGGAEVIVANYLLELKKQGHDAFVIVFTDNKSHLSKKLVDNGIKIYQLNPLGKQNFFCRVLNKLFSPIMAILSLLDNKLNNFIENENPDVIHWHTKILFDRKLNFPINKMFYTFHSDVHRHWNSFTSAEKAKFKQYIRKGLNVIVLNANMHNDYSALFPNSSFSTIPNGLNLKEIYNRRYERNVFLSLINIPNNAFVITMVGRFHPVKNHTWAIKVFAEVLKLNQNSYLLLVGKEDIDIKKTLLDEMHKQGIPDDKVRFMGVREDATSILSVSNACLIPSHSESFSLVALEAQVFGIRVVASEAIPKEVLCKNNAVSISLNETPAKWAYCLMNTTVNAYSSDISSYDISNIIKRHIEYYKRWVF